MSVLIKWLLRMAAIGVILSLALAILICWPLSLLLIVYQLWLMVTQRRLPSYGILGSARWAEADDVARRGMLGAGSGLVLGYLTVGRSPWDALRYLMSGRFSAALAIDLFWAALGSGRGALTRLPQAIHTAVFCPSGGGKGVSFIIPFLRMCREACVVIDFKGENALLTAAHRQREFGHQIVLLDPFRVVTQTPDRFNPLDLIAADDPQALDECNDLAKALVVRPAEEKEPHWNDSAEAWIAAELATVVRYGDRAESRSLQTVREFLSHPQKLELSIQLMCQSDAWGGLLARLGGQLLHFVDREKASTLSTASRHLRFLDTVAIAESTSSSTFDPRALLQGKMTTYLILPPEHMRAQSSLLRLWIGSLLRAVVRGGLQEKRKIHFILDEAASLGALESVADAVDKYRGYGVRLQFYYQSLGQLKKCFPEGQHDTLLGNTMQIFAGINDTATAEMVSSRLGEATVIVPSGGRNWGSSTQHSSGPQSQVSTGSSNGESENWQPQGRKLLKPEETMVLSPREAITFVPGMPPLRTTLLRYYEEPRLGLRPSWLSRAWNGTRSLFSALVLAMLSWLLVAVLCIVAAERLESWQTASLPPASRPQADQRFAPRYPAAPYPVAPYPPPRFHVQPIPGGPWSPVVPDFPQPPQPRR